MIGDDMEDVYIKIILFIFGSMIGSFLGCMGFRIPNKIKTSYPNSYCPYCKKELKWYMNIPIFSYIFLRGKCAYCKKSIGIIYFFTEVLCAILFVINYTLFSFSLNFYIATILSCMFIVTIVSDFLYYYISDRVILLGILSLIIVLFIFLKIDVLKNILFAVLMFIIMYLIKLIGNYILKKESLGDGDIKLMGVICLAVGLINSFLTLFIASISGLIFSLFIRNKNKEGIIPFGPFLLFGSLVTLYFNEYIVDIINKLI